MARCKKRDAVWSHLVVAGVGRGGAGAVSPPRSQGGCAASFGSSAGVDGERGEAGGDEIGGVVDAGSGAPEVDVLRSAVAPHAVERV